MPVDVIVYMHNIYILSKKSSLLTIFNRESNEVQNIKPRGIYPSCMVLNKRKNLIYVANTGSDTISVFDITTGKIKNKFKTGKWPSDLYLSKDNKFLYITCKYTNILDNRYRHSSWNITNVTNILSIISVDIRWIRSIDIYYYIRIGVTVGFYSIFCGISCSFTKCCYYVC